MAISGKAKTIYQREYMRQRRAAAKGGKAPPSSPSGEIKRLRGLLADAQAEIKRLRKGQPAAVPSMRREATASERRSAGAKQAAKTRAKYKLHNAYGERFGHVYGEMHAWLNPLMKAALKSGVDAPRLVERKRQYEEQVAEFDRKQAIFLATPITAETEQDYTARIKQHRLREGDCMLAWERYFEFREANPDKVELLTADDLAYAGLWTACPANAR